MVDQKLVISLKNIIKQGYKPEDINLALSQIQENIVPETPHNKTFFETDIKSLKASQILLFIGGLIMVLAGIIYISINWHEWNAFARIFAIFLPMVIVYGVGISLWLRKQDLKPALVFLVTGSLLLPLFLVIFSNELHLFQKSEYLLQGLTISLITLCAYFISSTIFVNPVWTFLYHMAGIFLYYFSVSYFKLDLVGKNTLFWGFLILGYVYMFLGFYNYQKRGEDFGKYPLATGFAVSLFAFIALLLSHPINHDSTWYLFIPTLFYLWAGYYFESEEQAQNSTILYLLTSLGLLTTIIKLSLGLKIIGLFDVISNPYISLHSKQGWSIVIAGILFLLISWGMQKAKEVKLAKLTLFSEVFETIGTLAILGGIFHLGLAGKKILYETLLLFSSLGFIFLSIFQKSRSFLYLGTVFLVVYIFDIGGEYFQNQVGWPLTLFVAGLISMVIGFTIEKLKRQYFTKSDTTIAV